MDIRRRMAGKSLLNNPVLSDLAEAALTAGVIAVPQALAGEADVDLALGVLSGLAVAAPGSYIGRKGGQLAGRQIDKYYHADPVRMETKRAPRPVRRAYDMAMTGAVPQSRHSMRATQALMESDKIPQTLKDKLQIPYELAQDRHLAYSTRADGSRMNPYANGMEMDLGMIGGRFGDNVAQIVAQLSVANALQGENEQ